MRTARALRPPCRLLLQFPRKVELGAIALVFLAAATIVLTKAAVVPFTYDEAFSDHAYAQSWRAFARLELANNHPLNSLAMYLMSRVFGHEPFALRLPNIAAFGLFAATALLIARKMVMPPFVFAALVMNALLLEFFSLARGYGISAAFALLGFAIISDGRPSRPLRTRFTALAALMLSAAAYPPMAIAILAAAYIFAVRDLRERAISPARLLCLLGYLVAFVVFTLLVTKVTAAGLPVYATVNVWQSLASPVLSFFPNVLPRFLLDDAQVHEYVAGAAFLAALLLAAASVRLHSTEADSRLPVEAAAWCVLIAIGAIAVPAVLGRPFPLARTLLPFIPVWTLGFLICWQSVWRKLIASATVSAVVSIGLAALVTVVGLMNTSLTETHYWRHERAIDVETRRVVSEAGCATQELKDNPAFVFYRRYYFPAMREEIAVCR
jgi:hypothetical protein